MIRVLEIDRFSLVSKMLQKGSELQSAKSEVVRFVLRSLLFLPMCLVANSTQKMKLKEAFSKEGFFFFIFMYKTLTYTLIYAILCIKWFAHGLNRQL